MANLIPSDLTPEVMQTLSDQGKTRTWIMKEYSVKSLSRFYALAKRAGCKFEPGRAVSAGRSGGKMLEENKADVDKLHLQGIEPLEISQRLGLKYQQVYRYVFRDKKSQYQKDHRAAKLVIPQKPKKYTCSQTTSASTYVETGKEMPPAYNPRLTVIIDKELAEIACCQLGLGPPVATLAQRPSSINANGWVRVDNKWVAGTDKNISGRVSAVGKAGQI